jgi:hypothetical protein
VQAKPVTECIVYFVDDVKKALKSDDDRLQEGVEIGRFSPFFGGEGSFTRKRFRVSKLNLYVFAAVSYDDDLMVGDFLEEAMTLGLSITRSSSENPTSWIASSEMQVEYREDFNAANLDVLANRGVKNSAIRMRCQKKQ